MNNVLFRRGDQTFIDENVPLNDGQIIFNETDEAIYVDTLINGSVVRKRYGGGNLSRSDIDMALSTTSENPIANKVVTNAIGNLSSLQTNVKTNLVSAINEVENIKTDQNTLAIVETGNTCTHTGGITKGQYVNWKGSLYTADSNISVGATFASSGGSKNLTAVVDGGLNDLIKLKTAYKDNFVFVKCGHVVTFSGFLHFANQVAPRSNTNYVSPYKPIVETTICLVKTGDSLDYTAVPMAVATDGYLKTGDTPCPAGYYLASGCYFTND
jgi:hypothetical protein